MVVWISFLVLNLWRDLHFQTRKFYRLLLLYRSVQIRKKSTRTRSFWSQGIHSTGSLVWKNQEDFKTEERRKLPRPHSFYGMEIWNFEEFVEMVEERWKVSFAKETYWLKICLLSKKLKNGFCIDSLTILIKNTTIKNLSRGFSKPQKLS